MEINFENAPDEVMEKVVKKKTEENLNKLTVMSDFEFFVEKFSELKDSEKELKDNFKEKLKNGIKYIVYKDPRRIKTYENKINLLVLLIIFLIVLVLINIDVFYFFFF